MNSHTSVTATQMQVFERYASSHFSLTTEAMMENAGRTIFTAATGMLNQKSEGARVLIIAGKGHNGGDALVAARLLLAEAYTVHLLCLYPIDESADLLRRQYYKLPPDRITLLNPGEFIDFSHYDLIIDGILGFSLKGDPREPAKRIIEQINCSNRPVLAIDVPSGFDPEEGVPRSPVIRATATITLGLLKKGLIDYPHVAGELYIGDLGIPRAAYENRGYAYPAFKKGICKV